MLYMFLSHNLVVVKLQPVSIRIDKDNSGDGYINIRLIIIIKNRAFLQNYNLDSGMAQGENKIK